MAADTSPGLWSPKVLARKVKPDMNASHTVTRTVFAGTPETPVEAMVEQIAQRLGKTRAKRLPDVSGGTLVTISNHVNQFPALATQRVVRARSGPASGPASGPQPRVNSRASSLQTTKRPRLGLRWKQLTERAKPRRIGAVSPAMPGAPGPERNCPSASGAASGSGADYDRSYS